MRVSPFLKAHSGGSVSDYRICTPLLVLPAPGRRRASPRDHGKGGQPGLPCLHRQAPSSSDRVTPRDARHLGEMKGTPGRLTGRVNSAAHSCESAARAKGVMMNPQVCAGDDASQPPSRFCATTRQRELFGPRTSTVFRTSGVVVCGWRVGTHRPYPVVVHRSRSLLTVPLTAHHRSPCSVFT